MQSPEYVQTSLAAGMALGFQQGRFRRDSYLTGLNLLVTYPDGCSARCAFCGLSRQRQIEPQKRTFIRVGWPTLCLDDVIERLNADGGQLRRVCVGMITHRRAFDDMIKIVRRFATESDRPISALIAPTMIRDLDRLVEIKATGADMIGVAVDAATPELFERYRGTGIKGPHKWAHYWATLERSVEIMGPYKAGAHLIVGLGETEQEMIATIQRAHDLGLWVEVVTLVIPDYNDSLAELWDIARFLVSVSPDIPWHVTAFHPDYRMNDRGRTPADTLVEATEIGQEAGLHYVYAGNLPGRVGSSEDTICPNCQLPLIHRKGYQIHEYKLTAYGACPKCKTKIAGVWSDKPDEVRLSGWGMPRLARW